MKKTVITLALVATLYPGVAQEHLSRAEALKYAMFASLDLAQLQATPIATDVDLKHAVAMRDGDYGVMILPETKLTPETFAGLGAKTVSVGQLWLHRLTPMRDGAPVSSDQLRMATVVYDEGEVIVPQCALGVRRTDAGQLELAVFGKDKQPLLTVPLKSIDIPQKQPVVLEAERTPDDAGRITVRLLGRFEAVLQVTEL